MRRVADELCRHRQPRDSLIIAVASAPAKPAVALVDANKAHPLYGPFIRGLSYANATAFVSEKPQRQSLIDAYDMVVLQGADPAAALEKVAKAEQEVFDEFFGD